ncbi:TIGR01244 family sulfur transferase [Fodinicurvata sp. EGI_FJ10296]|uniref:TIGR01244 family sulfur transferase n=1 Tax=Fodinicurvata sp. EGI_FJ10296 TaxID=3231908 RepID=UPI003455918E
MTTKPLDPPFSVAGQIDADDLRSLSEQGVTTIINNRPDGEEPGQLSSAEASALAAQYGIDYRYIPVTSATMTDDAVAAFAKALADGRAREGGVVAHCRSGTRSAFLWAMAEASAGRDIDDLVARAAAAGYDITPARPRLEALKSSAR